MLFYLKSKKILKDQYLSSLNSYNKNNFKNTQTKAKSTTKPRGLKFLQVVILSMSHLLRFVYKIILYF